MLDYHIAYGLIGSTAILILLYCRKALYILVQWDLIPWLIWAKHIDNNFGSWIVHKHSTQN